MCLDSLGQSRAGLTAAEIKHVVLEAVYLGYAR